jgi:hypothetical protein
MYPARERYYNHYLRDSANTACYFCFLSNYYNTYYLEEKPLCLFLARTKILLFNPQNVNYY